MTLDRVGEVLVWGFISLYFLRSSGCIIYKCDSFVFDGQRDEVGRCVFIKATMWCDVIDVKKGGVRTNNCKTEGMKVVIFEPQSKAFYKCASRRCYVTVVFRTYIRTILTSGRPCGWLRSAGWLAERLEMARERAKKREEGKFFNPRCINDDGTQYKTHRSSQPIREEEQSRLCERGQGPKIKIWSLFTHFQVASV